MKPQNSLALARIIVQTLLLNGVHSIVLAPGSRNAPLAYALAEQQVRVLVRIDERVAGFTALGIALATRSPTAIVTTSGTAVGNLLPSVMEAHHAGVPLVVLSADRPAELRGTGANQTTQQAHLFPLHTVFSAECSLAENPSRTIRDALTIATGQHVTLPAGPVQLNIAFPEPLTPPLDGSEAGYVGPSLPAVGSEKRPRPRIEFSIDPEAFLPRRSLVLAGHQAGSEAELFARTLDLPLLAEPSSQARYGSQAVGAYRVLLERFAAQVERIIVFGRPTLSRPVAALMARNDIPRALYHPQTAPWFQPGKRKESLIATLEELAQFAGRGERRWTDAWKIAAGSAEDTLDTELSQCSQLNGLIAAREIWNTTTGILMVGSSNPIRDLDFAARPRASSPQVFANRGLAGIDGTVATARGISWGTRRPVRVVLGDLTFLHDVGGLLSMHGEQRPDVQLIVLNDGGGGIFQLLEHGKLGQIAAYSGTVEKFFGTPHDVDLAALARAYGWHHKVVVDRESLRRQLLQAIAGPSILEIRTRRTDLDTLHHRLHSAILNAVPPFLSEPGS